MTTPEQRVTAILPMAGVEVMQLLGLSAAATEGCLQYSIVLSRKPPACRGEMKVQLKHVLGGHA